MEDYRDPSRRFPSYRRMSRCVARVNRTRQGSTRWHIHVDRANQYWEAYVIERWGSHEELHRQNMAALRGLDDMNGKP